MASNPTHQERKVVHMQDEKGLCKSVVKLPSETMCAMKFDAVAVVGNVNL
jgi:hypothetical protein